MSKLTREYMDRLGPKVFSVVAAYACFRYALGGRDDRFSLDDCINWLNSFKAKETE